ncbi:MAG: gamma-glutamyltransferase [Alphaproteobacteria bacterium]|nr:gamma-glutamyltransferase [Alphaproteobacteria bacterium]MCB9931684.1 gamma-glutamyltransferase [Alphaproteobacteria bacterium]
MSPTWRERAHIRFACEKRPATGSRGMVTANNPLGALAGAEMLAAGGNAVDAAVATLFTLTVVEPMMVGFSGGGIFHIRTPAGEHVILDNQSKAPLAARPDLFEPVADTPDRRLETVGRKNSVGVLAMATPGSLAGWAEALARFGTFSLADVLEPAIRHAARGFAATSYLAECVDEAAEDMAACPDLSALYLPGGAPIRAGERIVQGNYAETLRTLAKEGIGAFYDGAIGGALTDHMARAGGIVSPADLADRAPIQREPIRGRYRGYEIIGPPPPAASGIHIAQMLQILEGFDLAGMGFGSLEATHLLLEALKIAFADRGASTADPAFVDVPVARLLDPAYADARRAQIRPDRTRDWAPGVSAHESDHTTHLNTADADGWVVSTTQTINSLFGARFIIPGTGIVANNYMALFDPHPGRANSVAPGKRVTTSMSPMMACRDGRVRYALGLVGGLRIFPSAMQALVNLLEHGMSLQEAVEAPRVWTQGESVEVEGGYGEAVQAGLKGFGHAVVPSPCIGAGMNAIAMAEDGLLAGSACWRADGTAIGIGGGYAREGVRYWPERPKF